MQDLLRHIQNIEQHIVRLGEKLKTLEQDNQVLENENVKLKQDLEQLRGKFEELQAGNADQNVKRGSANAAMERKVKKELDMYIKEVDKCIQLMENIA